MASGEEVVMDGEWEMKGESAKNERRRVFVPSRGMVSRKREKTVVKLEMSEVRNG